MPMWTYGTPEHYQWVKPFHDTLVENMVKTIESFFFGKVKVSMDIDRIKRPNANGIFNLKELAKQKIIESRIKEGYTQYCAKDLFVYLKNKM